MFLGGPVPETAQFAESTAFAQATNNIQDERPEIYYKLYFKGQYSLIKLLIIGDHYFYI